MICGMTYFQICLYFLIYSFGGWVVEVIFHAVALGKVINRGFLNGPVCPVGEEDFVGGTFSLSMDQPDFRGNQQEIFE